MPRSAKGDLNLARGDFDACTASFAPSTFRNPARVESALAAWYCQQTARAAFLHAGTANVPSQCQLAAACRQTRCHLSFPMGHAEGNQGIVECKLHEQGGELNGAYESLSIVNATSGWL